MLTFGLYSELYSCWMAGSESHEFVFDCSGFNGKKKEKNLNKAKCQKWQRQRHMIKIMKKEKEQTILIRQAWLTLMTWDCSIDEHER